MTQRMQDLATEILRLRDELEQEIESRREAMGWRLDERIVRFEEAVADQHRALRKGLARFLADASIWSYLTAPVIYSLIVPFVLVDLWVNLYQQICFRAYGIPRVRRADYFTFDRRGLAYLNPIEAFNCFYCSYGNGMIAFVREVAGRTEQYWCPIKHALKVADPHPRYYDFLDYGDAEGWGTRLEAFRDRLRTESASTPAVPTPPRSAPNV